MNIISDEPIDVYNTNTMELTKLIVGDKYVFDPQKPTTKKDRKNKGRIVEIIGFNDDFMPTGAIVRYMDNNRRGMVCPCYLIPYKNNR